MKDCSQRKRCSQNLTTAFTETPIDVDQFSLLPPIDYGLKSRDEENALVLGKFKISTDRSDGINFGILLDQQGLVVASALGRNARRVRSFLLEYSRRMTRSPPVQDESDTLTDMIALFEGKKASKPFRMNVSYITSFQSRVHKVMSEIPRGRVTTYGLIASKLESGPRAVGNAVASNPSPIFIPCHRVVPSNLSVGNYSICGTLGVQGSSTKLELLRRETVPISGTSIASNAVWTP